MPEDPAPPPPAPPSPDPHGGEAALVDFDALRRRAGAVLLPVVGLGLVGAIVEGAVSGLTFVLLGRWLGLVLVVSILGMAVLTALHALGGAGRAGARGERLASPDVGIAPRRAAGRGLRAVDDHAAPPVPDDPVAAADPAVPAGGDTGPGHGAADEDDGARRG